MQATNIWVVTKSLIIKIPGYTSNLQSQQSIQKQEAARQSTNTIKAQKRKFVSSNNLDDDTSNSKRQHVLFWIKSTLDPEDEANEVKGLGVLQSTAISNASVGCSYIGVCDRKSRITISLNPEA